MKCKCIAPTPGCKHGRGKVIGYYCELEVKPVGQVQIGTIPNGGQFTYLETPWRIKKVIGQFGDYTLYRDHEGMTKKENNVKRIVNKL